GVEVPEFGEPITNLTVPIGRDATFECIVINLGNFRVGWVKADTKAIQAIHEHVITHNPRVSVSHSDHSTWYLHIKSVQEEDRGQYMCQINTDPMKSQSNVAIQEPSLIYLRIKWHVLYSRIIKKHKNVRLLTYSGLHNSADSGDFIPEETSGDTMVPEGGTARVSCRARGVPPPRVMWKREDGQEIVLTKISRSEMGTYLCIAGNGVPPTVSKRIHISVHCERADNPVGAPRDDGEAEVDVRGRDDDDHQEYPPRRPGQLYLQIPGNDRHAYQYPEVRMTSDDEYGTDSYDDDDHNDVDSTKSNRVPDRANKWYSSDGKILVTQANIGSAIATLSLPTAFLYLLNLLL
ncbi:Lachesin, partial [Operophtera brumata]